MLEQMRQRPDRDALRRADSARRRSRKVAFSHGPAMIRDEDGAAHRLRLYRPEDARTMAASSQRSHAVCCRTSSHCQPATATSGRANTNLSCARKQRLKLILPVVFFVIFLLLYMVFHSVAEALVLIFPTVYAMTGGLLLQWLLGYNFSVAVWVGYIALFGIAVETGVVMVVYLHEALDARLAQGDVHCNEDIEGGGRLKALCSAFDPS